MLKLELEKCSDNTLYLYMLLTGGLLDINVMTHEAKCMLIRRDKAVTTNAGDTYSKLNDLKQFSLKLFPLFFYKQKNPSQA